MFTVISTVIGQAQENVLTFKYVTQESLSIKDDLENGIESEDGNIAITFSKADDEHFQYEKTAQAIKMRGSSESNKEKDATIIITPASNTNTAIKSVSFEISGSNGHFLKIGDNKITETTNPPTVTYTPDIPETSAIAIHNNEKNIIITQITVTYTTGNTQAGTIITPDIRVEKEFVSLNTSSSDKQSITIWNNNEQITDITSLSATSSNENIAKAEYNDGFLTITSGATTGTATITLTSQPVDSKYKSATATIYVTVGDIIPVVTFSSDPGQGEEGEDKLFTVNEIKVTLSVEGVPNGESYDIYYTLDGTTPKKDTRDPDKNKYVNPIQLAATTFVNAVAYKKGTNKHGEVTQHVFRFDFTLIKAFTKDQTIEPGYESIIYKEDNKTPYVITTLGSKGDIDNLWGTARKESNMLGSEISGYQYTSQGKTDARGESGRQYSGQITDATNGCTGDKYEEASDNNATFSIPINGAYMKFEPKMDGQINAIVRQNGIIASLKTSYTANDLRKMSIRKVYVCDETGAVITPTALINSNSMMNQDIFQFNEDGFTEDIENSKEALGYYQNLLFNALDDEKKEELENAENAWKEGIHIHNILAEKDNGWLTVSRSYVRYSFPVKAGKTYFLMGNGTKIGPCGYSFKRLRKDEESDKFMEGRDIVWNETDSDMPQPFTFKENDKTKKADSDGTDGPYNITLNRKFEAGAWTSLVLPFSVSPSAVKEIFGDETEIIHFNKVEDSRIHLTKHFHQMIVAGTPVLIRPSKTIETAVFTKTTYMSHQTGNNNTVTDFKPAPIKEMTGGGWKITGSYTPAIVPANSYMPGYKSVNGEFVSSLYLMSTDKNVNGTRAWFERIDNSAPAKLTGISFDGIEDSEATSIDNILSETGFSTTTDYGIYNMSGQKVGNGGDDISGLAKGIYIMNGKKIVVR